MDPAATALPDAASEHEDGDERRSRGGCRASRDATGILSVHEDVGVQVRDQGRKEVVREREERGIRRVVYNFTPSYVYALLASIPSILATCRISSKLMSFSKMVLRDDGHWHRVHTSSRHVESALKHNTDFLATHPEFDILRPQHLPVRGLLAHLHRTIHNVPFSLEPNARRCFTSALSGHFPYGILNNCDSGRGGMWR